MSRSCCESFSTECSRSSTCFHRSESIASRAPQLAIEPCLGGGPVAHHGVGRNLEYLRCFVDTEPAKETHFYDSHFALIELCESTQGVIERDDVRTLNRGRAADHSRIIQRNMFDPSAPFQILAARVFDQNAPHQLGGYSIEVSTILPLHTLVIHQTHICLMHQNGGLQAVAGPLTIHVGASQPVQLVVNQRRQLVERATVPVTPRAQQQANVF